MKKLGLILFITFSFSFHFHKKGSFIPPGTVQITQYLFADKTEVSNRSWQEFEHWTKIKYGYHSKEHLETLPDTLVWRNEESRNEPYVKHYYRHKAYHHFPVVGISYEQALAFCKWRSDRVKEFYAIANKKDLHIEYSLPDKEVWETISMCSSPVLNNGGKDDKGRPTFNCKREKSNNLVGKEKKMKGNFPDVTTPVNSYAANRFGLFNSLGNVSEMVLEKGLSKGGSWFHVAEDCLVGKDIPYSQTKAWLGFRCICKVAHQSS